MGDGVYNVCLYYMRWWRSIDEGYINLGNKIIPAVTSEIILFGLLVSGNYIGELFSCSIQRSLTNNRIYKHILGVLSLYFFVTTLSNSNILNPIEYMVSSILIYSWFVIITLTPRPYTMAIVSTLIFLYLLNDIEVHFKLLENHHKFFLYSILFLFTIIMSFVGCYKYYHIKKLRFGNLFDLKKFIFGTTQCF